MTEAKKKYSTSVSENGQLGVEELAKLVQQLSPEEQAELIKKLIGNQDMSVCMGGFNANTVDVLVYIQSTDPKGLASVTEAIAKRITLENIKGND